MGEEVLVTEISTGLRIARIKGVSSPYRSEPGADSIGHFSHYISLAILPYLPSDSDHMPYVHDDQILPITIIATSWIASTIPELHPCIT